MKPRERVLTTLNRSLPDRIPKYFEFTPPVLETFRKMTGAEDPAEYFDLEVRKVEFAPSRKVIDFSRYLGNLPPGSTVNEWGIGFIKGSGYAHFEDMVHPLARAKSIEEIEEYPFPDLTEEYRWRDVIKEVEEWHRRGYAVMGLPPFFDGTIFETAWGLRGLENLLMDFVQNEAFAAALLDKVTSLSEETAAIMAKVDVDILVTGDDVGMQSRMMMSPSMWRKWLKPRLARVIKAARNVKRDILIFYHSCGYVEPIIPELIEIGVDVLNPVQPESMDPVKLKELYGERLAFWGTIGTQSVLPFGTPEDVKRQVKYMIETVGRGGGLVLAPTHVIEPEVPWENIMAFIEAVNS
ncbi:MAG: hypothetical protein HPY71_13340 [Firmicutes bacterium]|nr:hypothetical protein [Bacillota bacterium]